MQTEVSRKPTMVVLLTYAIYLPWHHYKSNFLFTLLVVRIQFSVKEKDDMGFVHKRSKPGGLFRGLD